LGCVAFCPWDGAPSRGTTGIHAHAALATAKKRRPLHEYCMGLVRHFSVSGDARPNSKVFGKVFIA
jgi:hypothetical protein